MEKKIEQKKTEKLCHLGEHPWKVFVLHECLPESTLGSHRAYASQYVQNSNNVTLQALTKGHLHMLPPGQRAFTSQYQFDLTIKLYMLLPYPWSFPSKEPAI